MLSNNAVNNRANIIAGFRACGIIPLNPEVVLSRLPPEEGLKRSVQNEFDQQLTEELKRNRYGEPGQKKRAKKANRLPPDTSYTVSAVQPDQDEAEVAGEPQAGPSGEGLRRRRTAASVREAWHVEAGKKYGTRYGTCHFPVTFTKKILISTLTYFQKDNFSQKWMQISTLF
jgi:hypothetical protein